MAGKGLTFLETDNKNLLDNAIAMSKEQIHISMAPQVLSKVSATTGKEAHMCMKEIEAGLLREHEVPRELPQATIVEEAVGSRDGLLRTRTIIHPSLGVLSEADRVVKMLADAEIFLSIKLRLEANVITRDDPCMIFGEEVGSIHSLKRGDGQGIQSMSHDDLIAQAG